MAARYASARVTGGVPTEPGPAARSAGLGAIARPPRRTHIPPRTTGPAATRHSISRAGSARAFPVGGDLRRGRVLFGAEHLGERPVHLAPLARDEPSAGRLGQERVLQLCRTEAGGAHQATPSGRELHDEAGRRQTGHGSQVVRSQRTVGHPQPAGDLPGRIGDSGEPPVEEVAQEPRKWLLVLEVCRQLLGEEGLATRAPMDACSQVVAEHPPPGAGAGQPSRPRTREAARAV